MFSDAAGEVYKCNSEYVKCQLKLKVSKKVPNNYCMIIVTFYIHTDDCIFSSVYTD